MDVPDRTWTKQLERVLCSSWMKRIGLFLSAGPLEGGMFQYGHAILAALRALPTEEYSLVTAYADPAWREHVQDCDGFSFPVKLGRLTNGLAMLSAVLPISYQRWGDMVTGVCCWADGLLQQGCDLWIFPRQDVWSALFPAPVLAAVHDLMHRYEPNFPETSNYGRTRYRDAYLRRVCQRASGILVDSEMGKRQVQESYGTEAERLFVLPYIAPAYLSEGGSDVDFKKKYRLPAKYVFYPAQFWEHKNHVRLIHAIAQLRKDIPDICLVLAGAEKNSGSAARREVDRLHLQQHIRFAGYVPENDMAGFYRGARA